jgi:predicted transposase YbfD/YdcC
MTKVLSPSLHIDFIEYCQGIEYIRQPVKLTYPLDEVLFLGLCGVISGCEGWEEISFFGDNHIKFLREYLPYQENIPSSSTIARVFSIISPAIFEDFFTNWFGKFLGASLPEGTVISIDGKTVCGSKSASNRALHMLHACVAESGLLLGYKTTDSKSNEITAIPDLLESLDINGCIVTLDAMGCQRNICAKIKENGGDYVIGLKGNQGALNEDVRLLLKDFQTLEANSNVSVDAGHGRVETRKVTAVSAGDYLQETHKWPGLVTIAMVKTSRYNKTSKKYDDDETRYYISSLPPDAAKLQYSIRKHWMVEAVHWALDVSFNEDKIHIVMDNAAENLAFMRKMAFNMMKMHQKSLKKTISINRLQKMCLMKPKNIREILTLENYLLANS